MDPGAPHTAGRRPTHRLHLHVNIANDEQWFREKRHVFKWTVGSKQKHLGNGRSIDESEMSGGDCLQAVSSPSTFPESAFINTTLPASRSATYSRRRHSSSAMLWGNGACPPSAGGSSNAFRNSPREESFTTRELQYPSATYTAPSRPSMACVGWQKVCWVDPGVSRFPTVSTVLPSALSLNT